MSYSVVCINIISFQYFICRNFLYVEHGMLTVALHTSIHHGNMSSFHSPDYVSIFSLYLCAITQNFVLVLTAVTSVCCILGLKQKRVCIELLEIYVVRAVVNFFSTINVFQINYWIKMLCDKYCFPSLSDYWKGYLIT